MNIRDKNIKGGKKKRNIKEKIKNFWKTYRKHHLFFISGLIAGIFLMNWMLFFSGVIDFRAPFLFTIFTVLLIILGYFVYIPKYRQITAKIVYIGFGGCGVGIIIWFIIGYVLITAQWAPLQVLDPVLRGRILLLLLVPACGLGALIMYGVGKKRNWKTIFTQKIENH